MRSRRFPVNPALNEDHAVLLAHVARALLLPPAGLVFLVLFGWLLRRRFRRFGAAVMALGIVLLLALSTNAGVRVLVVPLEAMTQPLADPLAARAQAIVLLSAGRIENAPEYGGADIPDQAALGRMRYAAHLAHATGLPILVTGGDPTGRGRVSEAETMAKALREDFRTPVEWVETRSRNTAENAAFSAEILEPRAIRRVLLVTDAMHMPRSIQRFTSVGLDPVAAPTVFLGRAEPTWHDWLPSAEAMRRAFQASYEWLGLLWYAVHYS